MSKPKRIMKHTYVNIALSYLYMEYEILFHKSRLLNVDTGNWDINWKGPMLLKQFHFIIIKIGTLVGSTDSNVTTVNSNKLYPSKLLQVHCKYPHHK